MFSNFLTRDDIFISYSRRDGGSYAAGLADKLTEKKFSCFIDKLGTEPNEDLPPSLRRTIRNCTLFVLVGTDRGAASEFVGKEVEEFRKTGRTILPVDFGGAVGRARWYGLIPGLAAEPEENADALKTGEPSTNVVSRIEKSFNYTRRNQRMFRVLWVTLGFFLLLVAASVVAGYYAAKNLKEADRLRLAAAEASGRAEEQQRRAQEAAGRAEEQTRLAAESERRADEAASLAKDAEEKRGLAEKKSAEAEKKTVAAEKKTEEAEKKTEAARKLEQEARAKADAEQRRAEEQLKRSRSLSYSSAMLNAAQDFESGKRDVGQQVLDSYLPSRSEFFGRGKEDQRSFEWRYLWRLYHKSYTPDPEYLRPTAAAFSPDGRWLAAAGRGLKLWDTSLYESNHALTVSDPSPGGPQAEAAAVAFSPDSKLLAAGYADGLVSVWEVAVTEGRSSRETGSHLPHEFVGREFQLGRGASAVTSLAFSPDGGMLVACFDGAPPSLWEADAGTPGGFKASETPGALKVNARTAAFSPDGLRLALAHAGGVGLWDAKAGGALVALEWKGSPAASLSFSPDGRSLAAAADDGTARVWDVASRQAVAAAARLEGRASALAFSPDGRFVATAGGAEGEAKLWDAATFEEVETFKLTAGRASSRRRRNQPAPDYSFALTFSNDGGTLALWQKQRPLVLLNTSPQPAALPAQPSVYEAAYSPDGRLVATASSDGTVNVLDARTRAPRQVLKTLDAPAPGGDDPGEGTQETPPVMAFSPDGRTLATSGGDGTFVTVRDADTFKESARFKVDERQDESERGVTALAFSPDGRRLAVGFGSRVLLYDATRLRGDPRPRPLAAFSQELEMSTGSKVSSPATDYTAVKALAFLRGGSVLAAMTDMALGMWDLKSGAMLREFRYVFIGEDPPCERMALSRDGGRLAVSFRTRIELYDVEELLACTDESPFGINAFLDSSVPGSPTGSIAFSPDGRTLAIGMEDGTVMLWNTISGQGISIKGGEGDVKSVTFAPDGLTLAVGDDGGLKFWFAATDEEVNAQRTPVPPGD